MYTKAVSVISSQDGSSNQDITFTPNSGDPDWTPKVAIVQWSRVSTSADAFADGFDRGYGFTDGTNQRCICGVSEDAVANSDTGKVSQDNALIIALNPTGTITTVDAQASFSTWLTNGMRINWSNAPAAQFYFSVLFLGGNDITNAQVGTLYRTTGTSCSITGLSFQPEFAMFISAYAAENTPGSTIYFQVGAATGTGANQWVQSIYHVDAAAADAATTYYSHGKAMVNHGSTVNGVSVFSSFNSDGLTLNNASDPYEIDRSIYYLVMKGGEYAVGNNTEPASTQQQTTTTSKDTRAVMIFGLDVGTENTITNGNTWTSGFGDNALNQHCVTSDELFASDPTATASRHDTNQIYLNITANATASSSTLDDEAALYAVSSTGFTLNWTNIGQARPFRYITFGGAPPTPVEKALILRYNLEQEITKQLITRYNIEQTITKQLTARYDITSLVEKSLTLRYDINALVEKLLTLRYDIEFALAAVEKALTLRYDVTSLAEKSVNLRYDITSLVEKSVNLRYDVTSLVEKALLLRYNLEQEITKPLTTRYNIEQTIEKALTLRYDVTALISQVLTLRYNLEQTIAKSLDLRYDITSLAEKPLTIRYNLEQEISKTLTLLYDIESSLASVVKALTLRYDIEQQIEKSLTARYDITEEVPAIPLTLRYDITTLVEKINTLRYDITALIEKPLTLRYNIIAEVPQSLTLRYNIDQELQKVLTLRYAIDQQLEKTATIRYNIEQEITKQLITRYDIATLLEKALTFRYDITTLVPEKSLTLRYDIASLVEKALTTRYDINATTEKPLTLRYDITSLVTKILNLRYNLDQQLTKPLTLRYNLEQQITKQLTIRYDVEALAQVIKAFTLRYNIQAQIIKALSLRFNIDTTLLKSLILRYNITTLVPPKSLTLRWNIDQRIVKTLIIRHQIEASIARYISDPGYSEPLRCRIRFVNRNNIDTVYYDYNSFTPDSRPFNLQGLDVRLAMGETGAFTMTIEDSAETVDKSLIGLGNKIIIEVKKESGAQWMPFITGFVRRIRPIREATGTLQYQITGYGSQIVFNERITNFKRAAKRTGVDSNIPLSTDSKMEAWNLFNDLVTASDVLPLRKPTIQNTGGFTDLSGISSDVSDFIGQIAPGLTDAASVANAISEITGAVWGCDANGNPYFRYPTSKHSGIIITDSPVSEDAASTTSINMAPFEYDDNIDITEGFANRLYVLNAVSTKSTSSSSEASGSTTLTYRGIAQQFTANDNNITSAAFILSKIGNPQNKDNCIFGYLRADNGNGYPTGATLASFSITLDQIEPTKSTIFVNDIKTEPGVIIPGNKYWWFLFGALNDDSNTIRWHHDNDMITPDRLSATVPFVDADPTKTGNQFYWIRSIYGPTYAFSTFSSVRHILEHSDPESIQRYGLIEGIVDLPAFEDDRTFQKALAKIIATSAKPKRLYQYNLVTIPTQHLFMPGELVTVIDSKAKLTSEKNVIAEIAEVNYQFDTSRNALGCKYCDVHLIGFLDQTLDDYLDDRPCQQTQ